MQQERDKLDFSKEENRMETLMLWPSKTHSPYQMATAGFYYTGRSDRVRCFSCGLLVERWAQGMPPLTLHKQLMPNCPFIKGIAESEQAGPTEPTPEQEYSDSSDSDMANLIRQIGAAATYTSMERTNTETSRGMTSDTRTMGVGAERLLGEVPMRNTSGRGRGRRLDVTCPPPPRRPGCESTETEIRTSQIAETRPEQVEGDVRPPMRTRRPSTIYLPMANLGAKSREMQNASITCRICLEKDREVVFMPCGHLISCRECGAKLDNCAICRKPILGYVRIFLS